MDELIKQALKSLKKEQVLFRKIIEKAALEDYKGAEYLISEYGNYSQQTIRIVEELLSCNTIVDINEKLDRLGDNLLGLELKLIVHNQNYLHKYLTLSFGDPVRKFAAAQSIPGEYDIISYDLFVNYLVNNDSLDKTHKKEIINYFTARCSSSYALRCYFSSNSELSELFSNPELSCGEVVAKVMANDWLNKMSSYVLNAATKINVLKTQFLLRGLDVSDLDDNELNYKLDFAAVLVQAQKYGIVLDISEECQNGVLKEFIDDSKKIANDYINKENKSKVLVVNSL